MHALTTALRARMLYNFGGSVANQGGVRDWIVRGTYIPTVDGDDVVLTSATVVDLAPHIHYDYRRFALASWESICSAVSIMRDTSPAWSLMALYYSAYFAAHSILRSAGRSPTRLEKATITHVSRVLSAYSLTAPNLTAGDYMVSVEPTNAGEAEVRLHKLAAAGGVHELLWQVFTEFLGDLEDEAIAEGFPWRDDLIGANHSLRIVLKSDNSQNGQWLSNLRNRLTYRHELDAWHPSPKKGAARLAVNSISAKVPSSIRMDIDPADKPLMAFCNAAQLLSEVSAELAEVVASQSKKSGHFGSYWDRSRAEYSY